MPVASTNRKALCREALIRRILRLDLPPGAELEETQIATDHGLSRTPLREIFQGLAGEGYLRLEANRGARVASLDFGELRSFFRTAPLLHATTARLAAENRRDADLARLKETQTRFLLSIAGGDPGAAALEDHAFHRCIGEMTGDPYLQPALNRMLIDHTRLNHGFYRPESRKDRKQVKKAGQQHDALIVAIENRAGDEAAALALQHWEQSRSRIERFLRPDPLPLDLAAKDPQPPGATAE